MRAFVLESARGPCGLRLRDLPDPVPDRTEAVVQIQATALNRADLLQTLGKYPGPPMQHEIPGLELAGVVTECGTETSLVRPGDRVCGLVAGGAFAERIALPERLLMKAPEELSIEEAGALPETALTAYDALVRLAKIEPGERVLVHAGASGVGTFAIQIAREYRCQVTATCSPAKRSAVLKLGADVSVDTRDDGWIDALEEHRPGGFDVILDVLGGSTLPGDLRLAATRARIVFLGLLAGQAGELDLARLMTRRIRLIGSVLRSRPLEEKIDLVRHFERTMMPSVAAGRLRPVIDSSWRFEDLPRALEKLARNETTGKVVVRVQESAGPH